MKTCNYSIYGVPYYKIRMIVQDNLINGDSSFPGSVNENIPQLHGACSLFDCVNDVFAGVPLLPMSIGDLPAGLSGLHIRGMYHVGTITGENDEIQNIGLMGRVPLPYLN